MKIDQLIHWSQDQFNHIPWRENRSLYTTLVSEIMLQQTTVGTVKNHYHRFLNTFPDLQALANATEEELLVAWKGLGYYRRAKNLKKIAENIFHLHKGKFPAHYDELTKIPGIGPYTAQALLSIGLDLPGLALDANLERVISRLYCLDEEKGPKLQRKIQNLFKEKKIFQFKGSYRSLNEALMDLGRTYCQARKADCQLCPLKKDCMSFKVGNMLSYPREAQKKTLAEDHEIKLLRLFIKRGSKILCYQKSHKEWLSGQWEVPTFQISSTDEKLKQYPVLNKKCQIPETVFKTGITKYKIENYLIQISQEEFKKYKFPHETAWRDLNDSQSNLSTATLKGLAKLKISL